MDYGDESRQMPPVVKKKFPFLKVVAAVGVVGLGVAGYFTLQPGIQRLQSQMEQSEVESKITTTQVKLEQTAKEIIEDISDVELNNEKINTYICSGDTKKEALVFTMFNYNYEDIIIISKLTFEEEIESGYQAVAEAINNKPFTTTKIYSGKNLYSFGNEIIKKEIENQNSVMKKYTDDGYSYYANFTSVNFSHSSIKQLYTFKYKVFVTLTKGDDKKFIAIDYTATSSLREDVTNAKILTFTGGQTTEYSKDILESIEAVDIYNRYLENIKNRNQRPLSSRYLAEDKITEVVELQDRELFEIGNGRWTAVIEENMEF